MLLQIERRIAHIGYKYGTCAKSTVWCCFVIKTWCCPSMIITRIGFIWTSASLLTIGILNITNIFLSNIFVVCHSPRKKNWVLVIFLDLFWSLDFQHFTKSQECSGLECLMMIGALIVLIHFPINANKSTKHGLWTWKVQQSPHGWLSTQLARDKFVIGLFYNLLSSITSSHSAV